VYDYDGNRFVDFDLLGGAALYGHAPPRVTSTLKGWLNRGYGGGIPTAGHELLAQTLLSELFPGADGDRSGGGWVVLFAGSVEAAVLAAGEILRVGGVKRIRASSGSEFAALDGARYGNNGAAEGAGDAAGRGPDAYVLRVSGETADPEEAVEGVERRGDILVLDELSVHAHLLGMGLERLVRRADIRVIGPWIAGGLPFCCLLLRKDAVGGRWTEASAGGWEGSLRRFVFPPVYMLKAALRALHLLQGMGGREGLRERYAAFSGLLRSRWVRRTGCLVHVDCGEAYGRVREALLLRGISLPLSDTQPLSVSFVHGEDLLKRSAQLVDTVLRGSVR
jgi:hypothetical protein